MAELTWIGGGVPAAESLASRLRSGSREAMSELFLEHGDAIYNYCFRRTASWPAAEDLTSQVFLTAWTNRHKAREHEGTLAPWLYGIANNLCRTHHRGRRRRDEAMRRLANDAALQQADRATRDADAERVAQALEKVATLSPDHQDVFFLACWEGLDYASCASALGIPIGTVRSRLARLRAALRLNERPEE